MHLLKRTQDIPGLTPEQAMSLIQKFDINFTKRHVMNLMDKFENQNADLALEVNKMEDELIKSQQCIKNYQQQEVMDKIDQCEKTLIVFRKRHEELAGKSELLQRPKREEASRLKAQLKAKKEGKDEAKKLLAEHPDLPLIIEGIKKLNRNLKKFRSGGC